MSKPATRTAFTFHYRTKVDEVCQYDRKPLPANTRVIELVDA